MTPNPRLIVSTLASDPSLTRIEQDHNTSPLRVNRPIALIELVPHAQLIRIHDITNRTYQNREPSDLRYITIE